MATADVNQRQLMRMRARGEMHQPGGDRRVPETKLA